MTNNENNITEVVITDIKIRFMSIVVLMIKFAFAAIPAIIIIAIVWTTFGVLMTTVM